MKLLSAIFAGLLALTLSAVAQTYVPAANPGPAQLQRTAFQHQDHGNYPRFSPDDQQRFDSYYQRYLQYRATNNMDEVHSMEKRMNDIYTHYGIAIGTPYVYFTSNRADGDGRRGGDGDDRDRGGWGNDGHGHPEGHPQLSQDDQQRFDSYYQRYLQYRATNNMDEVHSMEKRMNDIYVHYRIPIGYPYERVASRGRY